MRGVVEGEQSCKDFHAGDGDSVNGAAADDLVRNARNAYQAALAAKCPTIDLAAASAQYEQSCQRESEGERRESGVRLTFCTIGPVLGRV